MLLFVGALEERSDTTWGCCKMCESCIEISQTVRDTDGEKEESKRLVSVSKRGLTAAK